MDRYYLGVDASKGYADFVILDTAKHPIEASFQIDDTFDGHCCLYERLSQFLAERPGATLYAGIESTGGYENNWFKALVSFQGSLKVKTARLNPLGVNANSRASLKRVITDPISAQNVAEYLIAHPEKVSYEQQDQFASLRKQWRFVTLLTKQCSQLLNHLESLMYSASPELVPYCREGVPLWVLKLLRVCPTASDLARAEPADLANIPYITLARAETLIDSAQRTVASSTDRVTGQLIMATAEQILHLKETIKAQTEAMARECGIPEVALLKTFPGIGDHSALGLMLEIQTVERFPSVKKLAAFFGLHPVYKTSGDGVGRFRMSKKGRKEPRRILFMVVLNGIKSNPYLQSIYEECLHKGMEKMSAIGVCMHKTLRIIYGMLKHNRPFDPEIDRRNRERPMSTVAGARWDRSRRYQAYDSAAPTSRRQNAKRRERKLSHSGDNATKSGITVSVPLPV